MSEEHLLDEAKWVTSERENVHGSIVETHTAMAELWSAYLRARFGIDIELDATDAANLLDLMKDSRKATGERDRDTFRDGAGYNYCGWICENHDNDTDTDEMEATE